jgi:hypothetical protein
MNRSDGDSNEQQRQEFSDHCSTQRKLSGFSTSIFGTSPLRLRESRTIPTSKKQSIPFDFSTFEEKKYLEDHVDPRQAFNKALRDPPNSLYIKLFI